MPTMTGGRFLAEFLEAAGVKAVFFVPTILSRPLAEMDNMAIKRVLTHGEKAAAYMADGYARASGRPGVCGAQAVGAANLAAGLRDALLGNSPVISFSGGRLPSEKHKGAYQESDDLPLFRNITKTALEVDEVGRLPDLMRQAFREATSGNPGPVNLQLLGKHGNIEDDLADLEVAVEHDYLQVPAARPTPELAKVRVAAEILVRAKRPIIVAGGGARLSGAGADVLALAERLSIPVATSVAAYSLVPENHPLYVGVPGTYSRSYTNQALAQADLILYVGSKTGGQVTHSWRVPDARTPVIQIGIDPSDLGRNYPNQVSLLGDAKAALQMLLEAVGEASSEAPAERTGAWVSQVQAMVTEWRQSVSPVRESDAVPMRPERIMKELGKALPDDVLVVSDTGHTPMWIMQQLWMESTEWDFIRCAGSLGWAFPASLGAKCAVPERPVACLTGDGGFWYHIQELETAVRNEINTVTIVNNNNALNQEINIFTSAYDGNPSDKWGELWQFTHVDFSKLAETMGAVGMRVERPEEIGPAIRAALACGKPVVVEVMSDVQALAPTAWLP